jgi:ribosomal protein S18 acetylase RimI-like enzyme
MALTFRPAQPSDVDSAIPLIYSSGPAAFEYVFTHKAKGTAQEFLHKAFPSGAGEFGFKNHVVATDGNEVVGIGAAFSGEAALPFTVAAAQQIFSLYGPVHAWGIIRRGLGVEQVVQVPTGKLHYIAHLGVAPQRRNQGIGRQLIECFIAQGQAAGRTTAALDVAVTNPRAQALYERLGFVVTGERQSHLQNGYGTVANHRRMERKI